MVGDTVRDLLGTTSRPALDFPADDSGYGFDTIGDVLTMAPLLVEKYLAIAARVAETVVAEAVPDRGPDGEARQYPRSVRGVFPLGPPPVDPAAQPGHLRDTI